MTTAIAIVGGGISGTLTVLNCIKQSKKPIYIIWFDQHNKFCKGFAYSTTEDVHLLNVRANNMSVFYDEPTHFTQWLSEHYAYYKTTDFISRKIFGEYVNDVFENLKNANPLVTIIQVAEEVISIDKRSNGFELKTMHAYQVQKLVLAFGNFLPAHPKSVSTDFILSENYYQNAFHPKLIKQSLSKNNITIIGSGLTMIDVVNSLYHHNYTGHIHIISPHGYIPQAHIENTLPAVFPFIEENKIYNLLEILSVVNQQLKKAKKAATNSQSVIDAMRPYLQNIWLNFSLEEKKQFLRHLRHKWGVARHRAPKKSMVVFEELILRKKINLIKGRVFEINSSENDFDIFYSNLENSSQSFKTNLIINCTGPESDYTKIKTPLIQNLLKNQIIAQDFLKYGINGQKDGQISQNVYTLGPPLKGILWESTAVPEIRAQAYNLVVKFICK
jgi:uncharacterized NAD(P)/FAD-binding protein YdhS